MKCSQCGSQALRWRIRSSATRTSGSARFFEWVCKRCNNRWDEPVVLDQAWEAADDPDEPDEPEEPGGSPSA